LLILSKNRASHNLVVVQLNGLHFGFENALGEDEEAVHCRIGRQIRRGKQVVHVGIELQRASKSLQEIAKLRIRFRQPV